jgi:spermidine/putrescine transport system permease protein
MTSVPIKNSSKKFPLIRALRENRVAQGLFLIFPANLYLFLLIVLPLLLVTGLSFLSRGTYGQVLFIFNPANYARLFNALYGKILVFSLAVGLGTTVLCLLIGYPMAYYLAHAPARTRSLLLFLILLPFWTNFIIRIYAWMMILRSGGFLDSILQWPL